MGNRSAPIWLEEFFSYQCEDCMNAWPVTKQVLQHYAGKLYYTMHPFPLQTQRQSFDAAKAGVIVSNRTQLGPNTIFSFTDYMFAHRYLFVNDAFVNQTQWDLWTLFAGFAENFGVDPGTFMDDIQNNLDTEMAAINAIEFGRSQPVYHTPTYHVNGVYVTSYPSSLEGWKAILDPLLN